jgi:predicted RNA-binding Zn-ribbon protein involved in translation (DUF1610 family)
MRITILPPDKSAWNSALEIAGIAEQDCATPQNTITNSEQFECPDIECGAMFFYRRVSCGHFVPPDFCPTCGGPMDAVEQRDGSGLRLTAQSCQSSRGLILP